MLQKIKSFLSKGNRAQWCVFFLFAFILFVKCILFHWDAFHSILISSAWRDPLSFYKFYMAKLLMPLFIASFVFITKHYWWTIVVSLLVDIWSIANQLTQSIVGQISRYLMMICLCHSICTFDFLR